MDGQENFTWRPYRKAEPYPTGIDKGFEMKWLLIVAMLSFVVGCKSEASEVENAMARYANIIPGPRSYSDCRPGADIIREYTLQGRDQGVSVNNAIKLLNMLDIDASLADALGDVFRAVWKSNESASSLSNKYMEICQN